MKREQIIKQLPSILPIVFGVIFAGFFLYGYVTMNSLSERIEFVSHNLASTTENFSNKIDALTEHLTQLEQESSGISKTLSLTKENIEGVEARVGGFEQTVGNISSTVGTLEKLSKTDPELLQKYSKIYFLNEHYVPERLTEIENKYLYSESRAEQIHAQVFPYLMNLLAASETDDVTLYIKSAYRAFDEQGALKSAYSVTYGAGTANQFSADQGYSEHQLGTTIDFITTGLGGQLYGFDETEEYQWMLMNAHKYGFILSYPKDNAYYIFEPWHWRFVGVDLATYLYEQNKNFYYLEQREIDEYLVNLFD